MLYIILRGNWCDIVPNVSPPTEDKSDTTKENFHEEPEQVFNQLPNNHMKNLLGDSVHSSERRYFQINNQEQEFT
jgi:hypothetical protein